MKKLIIIVLLAALVLIIAGCGNKKILDFEYVFDYAIVRMPDGEVVTIEIDKWTDYEGERSMNKLKNAIKVTAILLGYSTIIISILIGDDPKLFLFGFFSGWLAFGLGSLAVEREI